jgi:2-isopropylmalate synthase
MQFLSSRPSTPIPFRPKRSNTLNLSSSGELSPLNPYKANGAPPSGPDAASHIVAHLEYKVAPVNGDGKENGVPNGS